MRFRHLKCLSRFAIGDKSEVYVKIGDSQILWVDDDAKTLNTRDNMHTGTHVRQINDDRWKPVFVGTFDPSRHANNDSGKVIASIRKRSNTNSEYFTGTWAALCERIAYLESIGDFASYHHSTIKEHDTITEREYRKWAKLQDALECLGEAMSIEVVLK